MGFYPYFSALARTFESFYGFGVNSGTDEFFHLGFPESYVKGAGPAQISSPESIDFILTLQNALSLAEWLGDQHVKGSGPAQISSPERMDLLPKLLDFAGLGSIARRISSQKYATCTNFLT